MNKVWRKLGLLYCPSQKNRHPQLLTHAANPLPVLIEGDIYRVFYSGRDINNRSSVGAVDIDICNLQIIKEHYAPFFEYGPAGSYFADGVSIGNCYVAQGIHYMLFMGWQSPKDGHWRGDIGRLIVNEDLTLRLESSQPFITSDSIDPVSLSYPWVLRNSQSSYSMWYGSTINWNAGNGEMLHVINFAESSDGNEWHRKGLSIPFRLGYAQAFSRPSVVRNQDESLDMWFSYRSGSGAAYRIGYATSKNGDDWELKVEDSGITTSDSGWDSEMIEYPFVFDHNDHRYMLYNGNGYGKSGFGLAVLE